MLREGVQKISLRGHRQIALQVESRRIEALWPLGVVQDSVRRGLHHLMLRHPFEFFLKVVDEQRQIGVGQFGRSGRVRIQEPLVDLLAESAAGAAPLPCSVDL